MYHQIADKMRDEFKSEVAKQQKTFAAKERALQQREDALEAAIESRLKELRQQAETKARAALSLELEDVKRQAAEKEIALAAAKKAELDLRSRARKLEEREKSLELEAARKIDAERGKIRDDVTKRLQEEYRLKEADKDKKLQDVMKANDDLRRKLEQGSQQAQGEVAELDLEDLIRAAFPHDHVEPVAKGINGADVIQRVTSRTGQVCGTIVWEVKRTKAWHEGWLQKLKDDQRALKAELAILVTDALPKDCANFGHRGGVWVAGPSCAIGLATALRVHLIEIAQTKSSAIGKNEKMEVMFRYLAGAEFRQRIEAIAEAFIDMQQDLQEERRVAERRWSKREKQIQRVITSTAGMYGDLQGLIGSSLQAIPALSYDGGEADAA